jgi:hypothetical protein
VVALGTDVVDIERDEVGGAETVSDSVAVAVWAGEAVSETFTPKLDVPDAVGVPDSTPFEFNVRPAGREVAADHV